MSKNELFKSVSRSFHKAGFQIKKHSPEILVAAGVVGTVASAVMACKATTKLSGILEEGKEQVDTLHGYIEAHGYTDDYTEEDSKKDLLIVHTQTAVKVAKLYAPAVALGALSIASIVASHNIMKKRNVAIAAAYTAVDRAFKDYKSRVVERFGEEVERELRYNIKAKEIEETVVNEKGKEKKVKKTIQVVDDPNGFSPYSIIFDDGNTGWDPDPEISKFFLIQQQNWATDKLKAQGYLFLNDVYTMLGAKQTKAGQVVGWIYDEEHPIGDNYVDFGMFDITRAKARDFVNGYEKVIVLDFNVDGNILDLMP